MKIRIIDLLNKIYNGETIPLKVIYDDKVWIFSDEFHDYKSNGDYLFDALAEDYSDMGKILNIEIEIIETSKKIEKLEKNFTHEDNTDELTESDWQVSIISKEINEIIDVVNKLEGD